MQNLKYPRTAILINSISRTDPQVGLYGDSEGKNRMLTLKQIGLQIPGADFAATNLDAATAAAQGTTMASYLSISKACTDNGDLSGWCVTLNPTCPCAECDYEYGITFESRLKEPGVNNNEYRPRYQFYGGKVDKIECTGGLIDDVYLLQMEDDILTQVTNDGASWVDGYRSYTCTVDTTNIASDIDITDENGVTTTVAATAAASLSLVNAINADATVKLYVEAFVSKPSASSEIIIIRSLVPGYLFTVTAGTTTTVDARRMCFNSKDVNRKVIPQLDSKWASMAPFTYIKFTGTTTLASGLTKTVLIISGAPTTLAVCNENTTASTYATSFNALSTLDTTGVFTAYGNDTGDYMILWGNHTVERVMFTFAAASTTVVSPFICAEGHFPYLTADDVFKVFAHMQHQGDLGNMTRNIYQTIAGAEYCHYQLKSTKVGVPDLHGANHLNGYVQTVDIYILKSLVTTSIYDKDLPATGDKCFNKDVETQVADTSFEDLLQIWANCKIANW